MLSQVDKSPAFPAPSHSTTSSCASVVIVGGVVSSTIKSALVITEFPQSSVAMKSTLTNPVAPQSSLNDPPVFVQVTIPQSSVAIASPLLVNHVWKSATFPVPSHSTVRF